MLCSLSFFLQAVWTLNSAFNKVFGEGLEPFGFKRLKKVKNKFPYFVRVINNGILHIDFNLYLVYYIK